MRVDLFLDKGARDPEHGEVVAACEGETARTLRWLKTRMKTARRRRSSSPEAGPRRLLLTELALGWARAPAPSGPSCSRPARIWSTFAAGA